MGKKMKEGKEKLEIWEEKDIKGKKSLMANQYKVKRMKEKKL